MYHDRYPAHTSKQTQTWMDQHNLQTVVLPPKSPDLNPIENVWGIISREIFEGTQTYNSAESLMAAVQAAWDRVQLDSRLRRRLVGSMPERLRAVKAAWSRCMYGLSVFFVLPTLNAFFSRTAALERLKLCMVRGHIRIKSGPGGVSWD